MKRERRGGGRDGGEDRSRGERAKKWRETGRGRGRARGEAKERREEGGGENRGLVTSSGMPNLVMSNCLTLRIVPGSIQSQPSRTPRTPRLLGKSVQKHKQRAEKII